MQTRIRFSSRHHLRNAMLAVAAGLALPGVAAAQKRTDVDVAALLPRLPVEIFDHTTEGIEADELQTLRKRGQSENWRIVRKSPGKVVIVAKRPFSEVNLRPARDGGAVFVEALTFNEKAINYSYWIPVGSDGPLQPHRPGVVFRLLNEREDGKPGIQEKDAPAAIIEHARLRERCAKPSGQGASRPAECGNLDGKASELRQQFAAQPRWVQIIDRIGKVIGE